MRIRKRLQYFITEFDHYLPIFGWDPGVSRVPVILSPSYAVMRVSNHQKSTYEISIIDDHYGLPHNRPEVDIVLRRDGLRKAIRKKKPTSAIYDRSINAYCTEISTTLSLLFPFASKSHGDPGWFSLRQMWALFSRFIDSCLEAADALKVWPGGFWIYHWSLAEERYNSKS